MQRTALFAATAVPVNAEVIFKMLGDIREAIILPGRLSLQSICSATFPDGITKFTPVTEMTLKSEIVVAVVNLTVKSTLLPAIVFDRETEAPVRVPARTMDKLHATKITRMHLATQQDAALPPAASVPFIGVAHMKMLVITDCFEVAIMGMAYCQTRSDAHNMFRSALPSVDKRLLLIAHEVLQRSHVEQTCDFPLGQNSDRPLTRVMCDVAVLCLRPYSVNATPGTLMEKCKKLGEVA